MSDLIIKNVEIIDGTGKEGYRSDVSILDGRISKIGPTAETGCFIVDGSGLTLAPGFIDAHTHSDCQLYMEPSRASKLLQGITFELGGQCGWSRGPVGKDANADGKAYLSSVNQFPEEQIPVLSTFAEQMQSIGAKKLGAHQAFFVGHNTIRAGVIGMEDRFATPEEMETMKAMVREAMEAGALGFTSGTLYAPGCYSSTEEVVELAKVAAEYGGIYSAHIRQEGERLLEAIDEFIYIVKEAHITGNISHIKAMFAKGAGIADQVIAKIEKANAEGCTIYFDAYPYTACSATILSTFPPSYLSHGTEWLVNFLKDKNNLPKLEHDIFEGDEDYENPIKHVGFDNDLIVNAPFTPELSGLTIHQIGQKLGMTDVEAYAYVVAENKTVVNDVRFVLDEEAVMRFYSHPLCSVGTDGLYYGDGVIAHPRAFATFPRYLGRYVRDRQLMSFEEGIRRMTGLTAERYGLKGKGFIREGYDADLVLFDKNAINGPATYQDPFIPNEGIKMVFVMGQAAVVNNEVTGISNGKLYKRCCAMEG